MGSKIIIIAIVLMMCITVTAQNHSRALATADTTNFSVNKKNGWLLFNSHVAIYNTDSVMIGLIIRHDRNLNLKEEQLVGQLKAKSMFPKTDQSLLIDLQEATYRLHIDIRGRCFLQLVSGTLPDEDSVTLPLRAIYRLGH